MRLRVVTRVHAEGSGLLYMMDQSRVMRSDGGETLDSTVIHGVGRRTHSLRLL